MMVARLRKVCPPLWGCLVILICGITFTVAAQDCTLSAFVEPSNAVVGQSILYILKLECAEKPDGPPDLPLIDSDLGFSDFRSAGTSSQLQIVNGRVSQTFEYRYSFSVSRKGRFKIPPARIVVGERELKSNEVEIVIGDTPSAPAANLPEELRGRIAPPQVQGNPRLQNALFGKIFVLAVPETTSPVAGQQFLLSYYLGIEQEALQRAGFDVSRFRGGGVEVPDFQGFVKDEIFPLPQRLSFREQMIEGRRYVFAPLYQVAITPTRTGKLTIEPFQLSLSFPYRGARPRPLTGGPFFDDFFDFDFGLLDSIPITVSSIPVTIDVQALPRPADGTNFSGAVGAFSLKAELDKSRAKANEDVVRLRVVLEGEGNASAASPPVLPQIEGVSLLEEPKSSSERRIENDKLISRKSFDYLLRPVKEGEVSIPSLELTVYNVKSGQYETLRTEPLNLLVAPGIARPALVAPLASATSTTTSSGGLSSVTPRTDLRYIHDRPLRVDKGRWIVLRRPWIYGSVGLPALLVAMAFVFGKRRERILADLQGYRRSRARSRAEDALASAKRRAEKAPVDAFAAIGDALRTYFADKLGRESAGALTAEEILTLLEERGVSPETRAQLRSALEQCDSVRYAPASATAADAKALAHQVAQLLEEVDQCL